MLELTLLDHADRIPLEADCLSADRLARSSHSDIEKLTIHHGNRREPLAEHFHVSGSASDGEIRCRGDLSTVKWVGSGMAGGRLIVEGNAGMHVGAEMTGGEIIVRGSAGDWVGAEMVGGRIEVHGNAGQLVGGNYHGSKVGMKGGVILVHGSAGNEIGSAMRRGLIAIGGDSGDFSGIGMIAGSILVFGKPGSRTGAGMKRGSIALLGVGDQPITLLPTFRHDCLYRPEFLALYLRQLARWNFPIARDYLRDGLFHRYNGDLLELGKGEILVWKANG